MSEHWEDALENFLSGENLDVKGVINPRKDLSAEIPNPDSKPEAKIWKHIDRWKEQGLRPQFEIDAKMLKPWGVEP